MKAIVMFIAMALLLAGCAQQQGNSTGQEKGDGVAAQGSITVEIREFKFSPATLEISKGTTVTWVNFDAAQHTATAEGVFDSGPLSKMESWSHTFDETGSFDYICTIHPSMKGRVGVR